MFELLRPFEGHESGQRLDEDFLGRILRVMRVCQHPQGDVVDPGLVPLDELLQRIAVWQARVALLGSSWPHLDSVCSLK